MKLFQRYPQFIGHLFGKDAQLCAMPSMESPNGDFFGPPADEFPAFKRPPEMIRAPRLEAAEKLIPQVDENDVIVRGYRHCQAGFLFLVGFAVQAVQRLVEVAVFASAGQRLNQGIDNSLHVAIKRVLICQVPRARMTTIAARLQPSQNCHHRILQDVLARGRPQANPSKATISKLGQPLFCLVGQRPDEIVTPPSATRSFHDFCFATF